MATVDLTLLPSPLYTAALQHFPKGRMHWYQMALQCPWLASGDYVLAVGVTAFASMCLLWFPKSVLVTWLRNSYSHKQHPMCQRPLQPTLALVNMLATPSPAWQFLPKPLKRPQAYSRASALTVTASHGSYNYSQLLPASLALLGGKVTAVQWYLPFNRCSGF